VDLPPLRLRQRHLRLRPENIHHQLGGRLQLGQRLAGLGVLLQRVFDGAPLQVIQFVQEIGGELLLGQ